MRRHALLWMMGITFATVCCRSGGEPAATREAAYRENNRGVAALEQHAYAEAVARFRAAISLDQRLTLPLLNLPIALYYVPDFDAAAAAAAEAVRRAPDSPHALFMQGLIARGRNDLGAATMAFERVLTLDPDDVGALVNLGQIDLQTRRLDRAVERFRAAVAREPFNATATYGLGQALIRGGAANEAAKVMSRFEELRATDAAITYSNNYLEQGRYAEAIVSTGLEPDLVDRATPRVRFVDQTAAWGLPTSSPTDNSGGAAVALTDLDGDGAIDLAVAGDAGMRIFRWNGSRFDQAAPPEWAPSALGRVSGITAADLDNDMRPDVLVAHNRGLTLLRQTHTGGFAAMQTTSVPGQASTAALLDVDHDGDLDMLAGGNGESRQPRGLTLLQNDGQVLFRDVTTSSGFGVAAAVVALATTDFDNGRDVDVFALVEGRSPALFANQRDGTFRDVSGETGLEAMLPGIALAAGDFNKDGRTDFFVVHAARPATIALSRARLRFMMRPAAAGTAALSAVQAADYDNDGLLDVIGVGPRGLHVLRNVGGDFVDVTADIRQSSGDGSAALESLSLGDIDRDGDLDVAAVARGGALRLYRNDGGSAKRSLQVTLRGRVSNRSGVGAKLDIRAGSLWQRLEHTAVAPAVAPLEPTIGLGMRPTVEVVRVLWPAGIVQAETPAADTGSARQQISVTELDRKPSSCPYLYTWNGQRFEFVSDFLGGGEMGYWTGEGWNVPDSDEYVRVTSAQLTARDRRLELRVTNELEEVLYLDQLRLLSIDHASDLQIYPREGMRATPANGLSLAAVRNVRPLQRVVSDRGEDLSDRVATRDGISAHAFVERSIRGYAEPHGLLLTLPPPSHDNRLRALLLTGWTDYAFSSDNLAAAQRGWTLQPPRLEQRTRDGSWRPLVADVGIPVGRPQTIIADIGAVADEVNTLRLVTNMRIHWDAIAIADLVSGTRLVTRNHRLDRATLGWRGYSAERTHGAARVPDYSRLSFAAPWKVLPGRYTREGDVGSLLAAADDRFVVAQTGDEIALGFGDADRISKDLARTFLLHAVGFSKEMDINSSSPDHVLPLPYRGMRAYPPPPPPASVRARQQEVMDRYNTRVVSRPLAAVPAPR